VTRLLLLRHAESEWNAEGRWQGTADPPLSARGEEQAGAAGELVRPFGFAAVVSSDLRRARRTAEVLAAPLGVPTAVDPGLREYDVGDWSGLTRAEIETRWPGAVDAWREGRLPSTPNGERRDAAIRRVGAALRRVAAAHPRGPVLVVTHGGVIGALATSLGAEPARVGHLAGRWFDARPEGLAAGGAVDFLTPSDRTPAPILDTPHR
jgi:probable phosphoglycerate mutase